MRNSELNRQWGREKWLMSKKSAQWRVVQVSTPWATCSVPATSLLTDSPSGMTPSSPTCSRPSTPTRRRGWRSLLTSMGGESTVARCPRSWLWQIKSLIQWSSTGRSIQPTWSCWSWLCPGTRPATSRQPVIGNWRGKSGWPWTSRRMATLWPTCPWKSGAEVSSTRGTPWL